MKTVVLAGGLGTRLKSMVPDLPKPMAPVAGRPFLEYVLDRLALACIRSVTLSVGFRADSIIDHFGDGYRGMRIDYSIENEPLGTGGALLAAVKPGVNGPVLALNGDSLIDIDFNALIEWYMAAPAPLAMVLKKMQDTSRYGTVLESGGTVSAFLEKNRSGPGLINAGVYIFEPDVLTSGRSAGRFSFESDILQRKCAQLRPRAYVTEAYFIDIGIPEDYARAQVELPELT